MTREQYVEVMRDLLSGDPKRLRSANQTLFQAVVEDSPGAHDTEVHHSRVRSADLVLAEVAG